MEDFMSDGDVRMGIIGFGGMGSHHGKYILENEVPGAVLTAVADVDSNRLEKARELSEQIALFNDADSLIKSGKVDAVLIATPHYDHPPLAIKALQGGLHALVEKPAGVYTRQVREMNRVAEQSSRVFGIMFNQRTRADYQRLRDLVASGELGEIRRTMYVITTWLRTQVYYDAGGWRGTWSGEGGGVLMNQAPHNLDLFQWICGLPKRLQAFCSFGKYHQMETEDDVTAYLEYSNGATGVFITSTGEAPGSQHFEVVGDRGKAVLDESGPKSRVAFWRTRKSVQEHIATAAGGFERPETWECSIPGGGGEEHKGVMKDFVRAIRTGAPLLAPGTDGVKGVELANAMHLSTWLGGWVDFPIDEDLYYEKLQEKIRTSTFKKKTRDGELKFAGTF
jgi:predicted dehydrogenase